MINKNFNDEKAVSPVIGVILMVAITVVLAAVVYVLVTSLSGQSVPSITKMSLDESGYTTTTVEFTVLTVDENVNYSELVIKVDGTVNTYTHTGTTSIQAGDIITVTGLNANTIYDVSFVINDTVVKTVMVSHV